MILSLAPFFSSLSNGLSSEYLGWVLGLVWQLHARGGELSGKPNK